MSYSEEKRKKNGRINSRHRHRKYYPPPILQEECSSNDNCTSAWEDETDWSAPLRDERYNNTDDWSATRRSERYNNQADWRSERNNNTDDWSATRRSERHNNPADWRSKRYNNTDDCAAQPSNDTDDWSQSEVRQASESENDKDYTSKVSNSDACNKHDTVYDESDSLSADFLSALRRNSFTDVSIKCGDYVQPVHKFVLSARSPVFEAMFSSPMEESEKGVVTMSDIDASVLDDMLTFIYGAQVKDLTLPKAYDLLYVAEKYQVKGLKDICTHFLRSCLSIQTAVQILQYADMYDEKLKEDTLNYVCKNFSALKTTEDWKSLQSEKPKLSLDAYSMVVEKYEEQGAWRNTKSTK